MQAPRPMSTFNNILKKPIAVTITIFFLFTITANSAEICSLEDNSEYSGLIGSVKALNENMNKVPTECKSANGSNTVEEAKKLQDSASKLNDYWKNYSQSPLNPTDYSQVVQSAVSSVSSISNNILASQSNEICGKYLKTNDGLAFISKLSDVMMNLAPLAMVAKVLFPTMGVSISFIIGAGAVLQIVQMVSEMFLKDAINLEDPEQRKIILKSVCDYRKIQKNIDYMVLISEGNQKIADSKQQIETSLIELKNHLPAELKPKVDNYYTKRVELIEIAKQIGMAKQYLEKINAALDVNSDLYYQCAAAAEIMKKSNLNTLKIFSEPTPNLPRNSSSNLNLDSLIIQSTSQSILYYKNKILTEISSKTPDFKNCAAYVKSWKENLASLTSQLASNNNKKIENLYLELQSDKRLKDWAKIMSEKNSDLEFFNRVQSFMANTTPKSAVISKADLYIEISKVRQFLLGEGKFSIQRLGKVTLVGAWLKLMREYYNKFEQSFQANFSQFNDRLEVMKNDLTYSRVNEKTLSKNENSLMSGNIEKISSEKYNKNSNTEPWLKVCFGLQSLYLESDKAMTFYKAIDFFCKTIEDLKEEPGIDSYIRTTCFGSFNKIVGPQEKSNTSWLSITNTSFKNSKSLEKRAQLIRLKMAELSCPSPEKKR
ncbi:MAG: hypothetical protein J0M15_11685 [Deltaproteobacteria bacterium]|nr:hypothetical protein [Deltaproteobacteria bacterium]